MKNIRNEDIVEYVQVRKIEKEKMYTFFVKTDFVPNIVRQLASTLYILGLKYFTSFEVWSHINLL